MDITDASGYRGRADQVFNPRSEEEIAAILSRASSQGVPVTIMGALTGLAGGAVPKNGWAISMAQFRKLDMFPGKARIGSGALLRDVQAAATASGQFYAPDPTENTSSIESGPHGRADCRIPAG
jgi:FAD/FMN-containing dehydrogenase